MTCWVRRLPVSGAPNPQDSPTVSTKNSTKSVSSTIATSSSLVRTTCVRLTPRPMATCMVLALKSSENTASMSNRPRNMAIKDKGNEMALR